MQCHRATFTDLEEWANCVSHTFVPLRTRCDGESPEFIGGLSSVVLGSVVLAEVSIASVRPQASCVVERTPCLIRQDDPELYKLGLQVSGTSLIEQDGRQAHLRPGDLTIYDTSRPYRISCSSDCRVTVAMFPRVLVRLPELQMAELTAVCLPGNGALTSLVGPLLSSLSAECGSPNPMTGSHLGDAVIDLIAAVFAERIHQRPQRESPAIHRALVAKVSRYIDDNLHHPDLTTTRVAEAHFVSLRFLQKVFESEGTSVSATIRSRRLERCRRDLADPRCQHVPISQIGHRWAFSDPAHFARLFRSTYGQSPREFRKANCTSGYVCQDGVKASA